MSGYWPKGMTKARASREKERRRVEREAKRVMGDLEKLGRATKKKK